MAEITEKLPEIIDLTKLRISNQKVCLFKILKKLIYLPLRFIKAGKLWCGGARETREPRVTIK